MDRAALERGEYAYGRDLLVGWPRCDGCFRAYPPAAVADAGVDLSAAHVYGWRGAYSVEERPWFLHGLRSPPGGSWTPPYADPVTGEQIVSYVAPLGGAEGAVVIAGAFAAPGPDALGP
ncbi:unnamed protein product [Prorocentrum cordatum]|uniref:Uncharacterized protein n=1 Tax=Prorocentrum cordatum TaxID=2364126 RepID=A0ABN9WIH5_9DINO|nr:unnamed protein product [Polarella glacialis]